MWFRGPDADLYQFLLFFAIISLGIILIKFYQLNKKRHSDENAKADLHASKIILLVFFIPTILIVPIAVMYNSYIPQAKKIIDDADKQRMAQLKEQFGLVKEGGNKGKVIEWCVKAVEDGEKALKTARTAEEIEKINRDLEEIRKIQKNIERPGASKQLTEVQKALLRTYSPKPWAGFSGGVSKLDDIGQIIADGMPDVGLYVKDPGLCELIRSGELKANVPYQKFPDGSIAFRPELAKDYSGPKPIKLTHKNGTVYDGDGVILGHKRATTQPQEPAASKPVEPTNQPTTEAKPAEGLEDKIKSEDQVSSEQLQKDLTIPPGIKAPEPTVGANNLIKRVVDLKSKLSNAQNGKMYFSREDLDLVREAVHSNDPKVKAQLYGFDHSGKHIEGLFEQWNRVNPKERGKLYQHATGGNKIFLDQDNKVIIDSSWTPEQVIDYAKNNPGKIRSEDLQKAEMSVQGNGAAGQQPAAVETAPELKQPKEPGTGTLAEEMLKGPEPTATGKQEVAAPTTEAVPKVNTATGPGTPPPKLDVEHIPVGSADYNPRIGITSPAGKQILNLVDLFKVKTPESLATFKDLYLRPLLKKVPANERAAIQDIINDAGNKVRKAQGPGIDVLDSQPLPPKTTWVDEVINKLKREPKETVQTDSINTTTDPDGQITFDWANPRPKIKPKEPVKDSPAPKDPNTPLDQQYTIRLNKEIENLDHFMDPEFASRLDENGNFLIPGVTPAKPKPKPILKATYPTPEPSVDLSQQLLMSFHEPIKGLDNFLGPKPKLLRDGQYAFDWYSKPRDPFAFIKKLLKRAPKAEEVERIPDRPDQLKFDFMEEPVVANSHKKPRGQGLLNENVWDRGMAKLRANAEAEAKAQAKAKAEADRRLFEQYGPEEGETFGAKPEATQAPKVKPSPNTAKGAVPPNARPQANAQAPKSNFNAFMKTVLDPKANAKDAFRLGKGIVWDPIVHPIKTTGRAAGALLGSGIAAAELNTASNLLTDKQPVGFWDMARQLYLNPIDKKLGTHFSDLGGETVPDNTSSDGNNKVAPTSEDPSEVETAVNEEQNQNKNTGTVVTSWLPESFKDISVNGYPVGGSLFGAIAGGALGAGFGGLNYILTDENELSEEEKKKRSLARAMLSSAGIGAGIGGAIGGLDDWGRSSATPKKT